MKAIFDTSSLVSLVRYYLPFDNENVLFNYIKDKIESGDIIVIDKVIDECSKVSRGIVTAALKYLVDKSFLKTLNSPYKTGSLLAPDFSSLSQMLDVQFTNGVIRKKLSDTEYENEKFIFLDGADMKQIILGLNFQAKNENFIIVTEETTTNNDNKLFRKIPYICNGLSIETTTIPLYFVKCNDIKFTFH